MSALSSRRGAIRAGAALLLLLPGGCGGLIPTPPERQLYRLSPAFAITPGALPHVAVQLVIATPTAPADLDTERIALTRTPVSLDYFAAAEWTDRVPFLLRAALVEGFRRSGAVAAVGPARLGLHADFVLETTIRDFEAEYGAPKAPPQAVVTFDAVLLRMPERQIAAHTILKGAALAAGNTLPDIVRGFDAALGQAVAAAVTWTVTNPALSPGPRSLGSRARFVR